VTLESLKNLEEYLPKGEFLRVHKSFIVAKKKVSALEGNLLEIEGQKIPISRTKRDEVVKAIFY
jgi:DNA-binding LytR/AlgR family response regulator